MDLEGVEEAEFKAASHYVLVSYKFEKGFGA